MRLVPINIEEQFDPSKVVVNPKPIDKDGKFTEDGIFSPRIFGSADNVDSFSCLCGAITGRFHSGETCIQCKEIVKVRVSDVTKKGWVDLEDYKIISPFFYKQIDKVFGGALPTVLEYEKKIDSDGNIKKECIKANDPFTSTGLVEFSEPKNFLAALDWFYEKNKSRAGVIEAYEFIKENLDLIFISKIPIYSAILRPATMVKEKFVFAEECIDFNQIVADVTTLKKKRKIEKGMLSELNLLYEIQILAVKIYDKITSILVGKTGFLRGTLLGSRVNFSVRTVISPLAANSGFRMHELSYPYLAAVELLKFEIVNLLSRSTGTYAEAQRIWHEATLNYSERVWNVMNELVQRTDGGLAVLLNRNPTIQIGSILYCVIKEIKKDYNDHTLNMSNNILKLLGADFDGKQFYRMNTAVFKLL